MSSPEFGAFIGEIGRRRVLTADEEKDLSRKLQKGDRRAHQLMVEHNMRLVISISKPYASMGFDLEDLVQEGSIGLLTAVEKFDPERGFKFSTYATWWIKQAVHRYMGGAGGSTIHVPARLKRARRELQRRMASTDETLAEAAVALEIDPEVAIEAMEGPRVTASLDASIGNDGENDGRHAKIADPNAHDPAEMLQDDHIGLQAALGELSERQQRIIKLRFGFDGPVRGRKETADELGVGERVIRNEQKAAIAMLRRILGARDGASPLVVALESLEEKDEEADELVCRREPAA